MPNSNLQREEYKQYVEKWGEPQKNQNGNTINASAPKILVKDKDGNFHLINSSSGNRTFEIGGKKYHESIY